MVNAYIENFEKYASENELFADMWNSMKEFMVDYYHYSDLQSVDGGEKDKWMQEWAK